jgi:hypothetical protein
MGETLKTPSIEEIKLKEAQEAYQKEFRRLAVAWGNPEGTIDSLVNHGKVPHFETHIESNENPLIAPEAIEAELHHLFRSSKHTIQMVGWGEFYTFIHLKLSSLKTPAAKEMTPGTPVRIKAGRPREVDVEFSIASGTVSVHPRSGTTTLRSPKGHRVQILRALTEFQQPLFEREHTRFISHK